MLMDATSHKSPVAGEVTQEEAKAGILPSCGISLDVPGLDTHERRPIVRQLSQPAYKSPLRHHRRKPSSHREVKETLNARSEYSNSQDDGKSEHHINQYLIKEEIGRGSFGSVHLATDQYGQEYAIKEFSKSRLRKRAQSNILRRPHDATRRPGHLAAGSSGLNAPLSRHSSSDVKDANAEANPLYLIKEEIAIMKKLNHPNLVSLIEVLDDPDEDSLYMVLEMCKKGVIMKVGLDVRADGYDMESCRCWFRDLILGIEYLHAQGVVHRDIKPDNLLVTEDDVLKIVDFGVSEMFEKQSEMMTAKSAGSPAFLPPELCVAKHGDISGKAADIWSMGVSLYCLRFGRIPFERSQLLELYEAIKKDDIDIKPDNGPHFVDLMHRILEKDPKKRITIEGLREHPWVTKDGQDPLLSREENVESLVEPPTETEMQHAITSNFKDLMIVMKAVSKFKALLNRRRPELMSELLGKGVRIVQPPGHIETGRKTLDSLQNVGSTMRRSRSVDVENRRAVSGALAAEGVHYDIDSPDMTSEVALLNRMDSLVTVIPPSKFGMSITPHHEGHHVSGSVIQEPSTTQSGDQGHAHDPADDEPLWLGIGTGRENHLEAPETDLVAESPTAAEFNIYDTAYQEEVERIREAQGHRATVYLTRRVDSKKEYKADEHMISAPQASEVTGQPHAGFKGLLDAARAKQNAKSKDGETVELKADVDRKNIGQSLREMAVSMTEHARDAGDSALQKGHDLKRQGTGALPGFVQKIMDKSGADEKGTSADREMTESS